MDERDFPSGDGVEKTVDAGGSLGKSEHPMGSSQVGKK